MGLFKLWRSRIDRIAQQNARSGATSTVALWWASGLTESTKKCPIWDDNNFSPPAGLLDLRYFRIDRIALKKGRSGGDDNFRSARASFLPQFSPHGNFACNRRFDRISTFYARKKNKVRIFSLQNRGRLNSAPPGFLAPPVSSVFVRVSSLVFLSQLKRFLVVLGQSP